MMMYYMAVEQSPETNGALIPLQQLYIVDKEAVNKDLSVTIKNGIWCDYSAFFSIDLCTTGMCRVRLVTADHVDVV